MTYQFAHFDTLLNGHVTLGVAVSGGGDSVALLYALAEWGRRPLHVLCVDHGLNASSVQWTQGVEAHARRLGLPFSALAWTGDKPRTGLSAAARVARHALLGEAARAHAIAVLCLGHTADDVAEAAVMREQGSNVGTPRTWSPSPAWPQGRGVTLCRPLLQTRRADLRAYLTARGIGWIDDPANENAQSLRARARRTLQGAVPQEAAPMAMLPRAEVEGLLHDPEDWAELGLLRFDAGALRGLPWEMAVRLLAAAAVCAGGGNRLPRRDSVARLLDRLDEGNVHTLCGARLWQADSLIHVAREAGENGRNAAADVVTVDGQGVTWDGRFEVSGRGAARISGSAGIRAQLSDSDRAYLAVLPVALRATLPVLWSHDQGPILARPAHGALRQDLYDTFKVRGCVKPRFLAAVCRIIVETDL